MANVRKSDDRHDISKLSDDDLQDLFAETFTSEIGRDNNIDEFECKVARTVGSSNISIELDIFGFAGAPTLDDFKSGKLGDNVVIEYNGKDIVFKLDKKQCMYLSGSDYRVTYSVN